jgi:hypothetical protein
MIVAPAALSEYGWYFHEKCRCGGILKWKFRHKDKPGYQLEWLVRYFQFKVMNGNSTAVGMTKIADLENVLKTL